MWEAVKASASPRVLIVPAAVSLHASCSQRRSLVKFTVPLPLPADVDQRGPFFAGQACCLEACVASLARLTLCRDPCIRTFAFDAKAQYVFLLFLRRVTSACTLRRCAEDVFTRASHASFSHAASGCFSVRLRVVVFSMLL